MFAFTNMVDYIKMKLIIALLSFLCAAQALNICNNCLDANCNFNCTGLECQAFSYTKACANQGCVGGYCCPSSFYISFSPQSMNYTYCVACNYTYPGCVGCSYKDFCTQCEAQYLLKNGICYNLNGTPVGAVPSWQGVWISFVVLFGIFSACYLVMSFVELGKKGGRNMQPSFESERRATQLTKT